MKNRFRHILSVFLAALVLLSTFSFTIEKHYCMGQLASYSLLGPVEGCEMPMSENSDDNTSLTKIPCCNDVIEIIEGTNSELKISKELSSSTIQFTAAFFISYSNLFEGLPENIIPFRNHSPPLLTKDIQVLHETYLI
ncbi:MAG: hypothetical protein QNJ57_01790 [Flavobacteriaceae bacterium]|nr:hypothetical protein [Flavobacteriaceae bacterium]